MVETVKRHKLWTMAGIAAMLVLVAVSGYGIYSLLHRNPRVPFQRFHHHAGYRQRQIGAGGNFARQQYL